MKRLSVCVVVLSLALSQLSAGVSEFKRDTELSIVNVVFSAGFAYGAAADVHNHGRLTLNAYGASALSGMFFYLACHLAVTARKDLHGVVISYKF